MVSLYVDDLATTVVAIRRNMVTAMRGTGLLVLGQGRGAQRIVCATHATLGTGFTVLLNGHDDDSKVNVIRIQSFPFNALRTSKGLSGREGVSAETSPLLSCSRETAQSASS